MTTTKQVSGTIDERKLHDLWTIGNCGMSFGDFKDRILAAIQPDHEPQLVACPCTMNEQDESCLIGYPSLICGVCKGVGHTTQDKITELAVEMLKVASELGETEDPFAAWESLQSTPSSAGTVSVEEAARVLLDAVLALDGIPVSRMTDHQKELFILDRAALRALAGERA